ncbi:phospholipid methyltransferase-domain-containing protein [Cladochytrium replicatum]|nr:phospholipid methyltransferase-domain-containing protein [Cladochytrium replicatum]
MERVSNGISKFTVAKDFRLAFSLPATSNVVTNLLLSSPLSYTFFERIILIPLLFQLYLFFVVRSNRVTFLCLFVFWRITYNLGLGLLLREQSQSRLIVRIVRRMGFGNSSGVKNEWIYFLQKEIQTKMGTTVSFDDMPIEYRAWMLFRGLVDVILVNDFASYVMFAMAYYQPPAASHNGYPRITDFLRLFGGTFLLLFNLWVKMDAHRVVKDYAWYWGDFFFQVEQSLKFDGVFSMAPHPMYSVGYVGFYGASLIVNSYWVFYVSLVAHAAQFAFLYLVENPHIEKAYGSSRRSVDSNAHRNAMDHEIFHKYFRRDLILFKNFDWFRSTDILSVLIPLYSVATALFVGPADNFLAIECLRHAVFWRFIYTYVLGAILHFQSTTKFWNRHFIKFGETPREAFQHWKVIYNLSQLMTYLSFLMCAVRLYSWPEDWSYGTILLQHISGTLLIVLHMWTALSVYDVLGDFGWFYGDFFIDELVIRPNRVDGKKTSRYLRDLRYTGIYRFLNNPEKIMGHASFWGLTLITSSKLLFLLTMFGQVSNWAFLHYVERPHMRRLYGNQAVRAESSVSKALRKEVVEKVERVVERVKESLEGVIDVDGRAKREQYESDEGERSDTDDDETVPLRRSLSVPAAMSSQMTGIVGTNHSGLRARRPLRSRTERNVSTSPGRPSNQRRKGVPVFVLGEPIVLEFTAPRETIKHNDWIGLYNIAQNHRRDLTTSQSRGRWLFLTSSKRYDEDALPALVVKRILPSSDPGLRIVRGRLTFRGDLLPWTVGLYEARYHYDIKYQVLARSITFEVVADRFEPDVGEDLTLDMNGEEIVAAIEKTLLPFVARAIDIEYDIRNETDTVVSRRIVYAIKQVFGIDFSWKVVDFLRTVHKLAERVGNCLFTLQTRRTYTVSSFID